MNNGHKMLLAIAAAWAAWLAAQVLLALTLRVEGYDGYWYLSNAWYMAGGAAFHYEVTKAPLVSLLLLPMMLLRRLGLPEVTAFAGSHLTMLGLTAVLGLMVVGLLRRRFGIVLAGAAAFAFLGSRIVARYAVFAMSDLAATAGVLLALLAVEQAVRRDGWRARLPFAVAVGLSILARYPAGLVLPVGILWDLFLVVRGRGFAAGIRRLWQHTVAAGLMGLALALIHFAVYLVPFGTPGGVVTAFKDMALRNARLGGISVRGLEPWWEYGPMMILACTLPAVLFMAWGMLAAWRDGGRREALHGLWLVVYMVFASLISSHKEARYILPALPSLFLFLLWGLRAAGDMQVTRRLPARRALAVGFLLAMGILGMVREGRVLSQPFFRIPAQRLLAEAVDAAAPAPARLVWAGNFYPLVPPRHLFAPSDEYYYVYHVAPHVLEYYLGREIDSLRGLQMVELDGVLYPLGAGTYLESGDQVISSVPGVTVTSRLEATSRPLIMAAVDRWNLARSSGSDESGYFLDPVDPISARVSESRLTLSTTPGVTEVVVRRRSGLTSSLGVHLAEQGSLSLVVPGDWSPAQIDSVQVVRFTPRPLQPAW